MSALDEFYGFDPVEPSVDVRSKLQDEVTSQRDSYRKSEILSKLPEDLLLELKGHLLEVYHSYREHRGSEMPVDPDTEKRLIAGALFEMLIQNDKDIYEVGTLSPLNDRLVALTHDPQRFALLKQFGYQVRNPDAAYFDMTESGVVVLHALGEAKLGLLDERCIAQMKSSGSQQGVRIMIREVNKLLNPENPAMRDSNLSEHGLLDVMGASDAPDHVTRLVIEKGALEQILIVPANRRLPDIKALKNISTLEDLNDPTNKNAVDSVRALLVTTNEKGEPVRGNDKIVLELIEQLKHTTVKKSVFSTSDVYELASVIYSDIIASDEWQEEFVNRYAVAKGEIARVVGGLDPENIDSYIEWVRTNLDAEPSEILAEPLENVSPESESGTGQKIYRHTATGIEGTHEKDNKKAKREAYANITDHLNMWKIYLQKRDGTTDLSKLTAKTILSLVESNETN